MATLIAMVWLMSGCATTIDGPTMGELPSPQQAVARLQERQANVRSFVMQGSLSARTAEGRDLSGDHVIYGVYPDRLRADVLGPFGQPVLRMIADGNKLSVLSFDENRLYLGRATRQNVAAFLGVNLSPDEVFTILGGGVPFLRSDNLQETAPAQPGAAMLTITDGPARIVETVEFDLADYSIRQGRLRQHEGPYNFLCRFDKFTTGGPWRYPRTVEIESADGRALALENDELLINEPVDGKVFEAPTPKGIEVRWLK
ncbi:hypothetical protein Deba_1895 [Desulfarculus baarsii DSM 2075]|uniref:DUF4292 domain-containing protein n=1 Tax=Desulfarculus baarsii (strain ATCC 33931 / DSM 2075 / LMG 7858 / VKM B-1802 / 2st14) TaxID=644282 RepID=E1QKZ5_DESB2|nr:DUF4292 domain-containing protein [Desulfarculus baarsii]ADK85260.1 hypothetical protein Deba_1895 [Desulfarculus baarsii DSM 2075]